MAVSRVLVISDLHMPFQHKDSIKFFKSLYKEYKCNRVVCIGDEFDLHAMSFHDHDPDGLSAADELKLAKKEFSKLIDVFPKVDVCISNHTARPFRRAFKHGIASMFMASYHDWMEAPKGWQWYEQIFIDGAMYIHGTKFSGQNGARTAALKNRISTIIGHIHSHAGVQYLNSIKGQIFGLNVGCMIDFEKYAFKYAKEYPDKPTIGGGVVIDGKEGLFKPL